MVQRCTSIFKIRIRTFWKTLCLLVTLVMFTVWTLSYHRLSVGDIKIPVQFGGVDVEKSLRSSLSNIFNTDDTGSSKNTNFTAVILLTYMRSGSSITGEILQQNEHVFYVFEPLRILSHIEKTNQSVLWLNGTRSHISTLNITRVKKQILTGWLTCNFSLVPAQAFDDWYFLSFGKKTDVYNECIFKHFGIKKYNQQNSTKTRPAMQIRLSAHRRGSHEKCLQSLKYACLSSKFRIIKTIRTSMNLADDILTDIHKSKIIHLVRDPRDTVISQIRYQGCAGGKVSVIECSTWHCRQVDEDTDIKERLLLENPERVYTLLYERISLFPIYYSKLLYKFIGMDFSDISEKVTILTQGGNTTGCKVCEQSWQSRNISNVKSRQSILRMSVNRYMKSLCRSTLSHYGYMLNNVSRLDYSNNKIINV